MPAPAALELHGFGLCGLLEQIFDIFFFSDQFYGHLDLKVFSEVGVSECGMKSDLVLSPVLKNASRVMSA